MISQSSFSFSSRFDNFECNYLKTRGGCTPEKPEVQNCAAENTVLNDESIDNQFIQSKPGAGRNPIVPSANR
jgi:hypothetical protein